MNKEQNLIKSNVCVLESGHPHQKHADIIDSPSREALPIAVTGLILCGGKSERMGRPKAFLPFGGKTIIEHLIDTMREVVNEVFLVTNDPDSFSHLSVDVVKDILPYRGPLGGILSGLLVASNPHALVVACDLPLLTGKLMRDICGQRHGTDVVVLSHKEGIEPLFGIYSKNLIKSLEESLFSDHLKVQDFLSGLKATTFNYQEPIYGSNELPVYFNVNTPADYSDIVTKTRQTLTPHPVSTELVSHL